MRDDDPSISGFEKSLWIIKDEQSWLLRVWGITACTYIWNLFSKRYKLKEVYQTNVGKR